MDGRPVSGRLARARRGPDARTAGALYSPGAAASGTASAGGAAFSGSGAHAGTGFCPAVRVVATGAGAAHLDADGRVSGVCGGAGRVKALERFCALEAG